jgi:murein DD-endopeptidase MepM/ murein hydrolase activator NlpD
MLRKLLTSLFCSLLLAAQSYSQDVFVPRELKAQAVHPPTVKEHAEETKAPKKEVVRRAEPVTAADLKAPAIKETGPSADAAKSKTPKADVATAKTEKAPSKEKASATVKVETANTEPLKEKAEKTVAVKEKPANPATVKAQPVKTDPATVKVEKAIAVKDESASKTVAKTETAKAEPPKEKAEKASAAKEKPASDAPVKAIAKTEKAPAKEEAASKSVAKTDSVKVETVTAKTEKAPVKEKPATVVSAKTQKEEKAPSGKEESATKTVAKAELVKTEPAAPKTEKPAAAKEKAAIAKVPPAKADSAVAKVEKAAPAKEEAAAKTVVKSDSIKEKPAKSEVAKTEPRPPAEGPITVSKTTTVKAEQVSVPSQKDSPQIIPALSTSLETGFTRIANGFDFPVGKPDAEGYYKARGFRSGGHVGEDWDGTRGGDTDLKDPIFSIGDGIVVFARDVHLGWGNVIIVRHAYRENGMVKYIDALYGHLNTMLVGRGQKVSRGQQIATMGTAHGQYDAHLHFEIRKNLEIGMSRSKFEKSFSNYYDPTQFISSHRQLSGGGANYKVAMNTFTHDWMYKFDSNRNFSGRKRGTGESSAALRRALTSR